MKVRSKMIIVTVLTVSLGLSAQAYSQNQSQSSSSGAAQGTSGASISIGLEDQNWDPFKEMNRVQEQMQSLFQNLMGDQLVAFPRPSGRLGSFAYSPDLDMADKEDHYRIELDLPGMEKDQINIEIKNRMLTITGERKREENTQEESEYGAYFYRGRSFGQFRHSLELPENTDEDGISASYENGVLIITIPKKEPAHIEEEVKRVQVV